MMDELKWSRDERPGALSLMLWSLAIWIVAMAQVGLFHRIPVFGAPVEITLAAVLFLSWRRGAVVGCVSGLVGGFTLDALCEVGLVLCPLIFVGAAALAAFLSKRLFDHPLTYFGALLPAYLVLGVFRSVQEGSVRYFFAMLLGAYLASAVLYLPVFLRRMKRRR